MQKSKRANQGFGKKNYTFNHQVSGNKKSFHFGSSNSKRTVSSSRNNRGEKIDISRFILKSSNPATEKAVEIKNSFDNFDLCKQLRESLKKRNYVIPTPIQDQAINHILEGKDIVGVANTGTGKTAAFLLPLINKVFKDKSQKVLIIAPTRELALQIENELRLFSWGMKLFFAVCVGGLPIHNQIKNLKRDPNFVIGTPGRLKDLNNRNLLKFESFNNVVLDEVDRMLDMGFIDDIRDFLNKLPKERQSLFFSATVPPKIRNLVANFSNNPITIEVTVRETAGNVEQDVVRVSNKAQKFSRLQDLLNQDDFNKVLIFSKTKHEVEKLAVSLIREGFKAESIHGDKRQGQRQRALSLFKNNHIDILVATDVAARGLDIQDITHVINYTVPQTYDDYIHRIGRTGRGSSNGKALTFVEAR